MLSSGVTTEHRRLRDHAGRHRLITATARALAEREGWDAVTTRRLSAEIEFSQPVIYKHFRSMEGLIEAVAVEGFRELADAIGRARRGAAPGQSMNAVVRAYCDYAMDNPAVYDAMFIRDTRLRFAAQDTPTTLTGAYDELRGAVVDIAGERDVDTLTELVWATLHGLITLGRNNRLRSEHEADRVDLLVAQLSAATP